VTPCPWFVQQRLQPHPLLVTQIARVHVPTLSTQALSAYSFQGSFASFWTGSKARLHPFRTAGHSAASTELYGLNLSLLFERASIAVRFASMRTCEYLSSIRRLTCPAIAMMVESAAPLSASWPVVRTYQRRDSNSATRRRPSSSSVVPLRPISAPPRSSCCRRKSLRPRRTRVRRLLVQPPLVFLDGVG
jgi:hypothetical protein